jgi:hypothetical protein
MAEGSCQRRGQTVVTVTDRIVKCLSIIAIYCLLLIDAKPAQSQTSCVTDPYPILAGTHTMTDRSGTVMEDSSGKPIVQANTNMPNGRPIVIQPWQRDYLVITFDARTGRTYWYDYVSGKKGAGGNVELTRSGAFAPVTYTKEKILVRICGLRFGMNASATPSVTAVPEGAPDIRGLTTSTGGGPAAQTQNGPGGQLSTNLSSPPPAPTASQIAAEALAYQAEYHQIQLSLDRYNGSNTIDSVGNLLNRTHLLLVDPSFASPDAPHNVSAFTTLYSKAQSLGGDVSGLQAQVASMSALLTQLNLDWITLNNDLALYKQTTGALVDQAKADAQTGAQTLKSAPSSTAQQSLDSNNKALATALANDEQAREALRQALQKVGVTDIKSLLDNEPPANSFNLYRVLLNNSDVLHNQLSLLFDRVNALRERSDVVVTQFLQPVTSNSVVTVAISTQDTYTPLTFGTAQQTPAAPQQASTQQGSPKPGASQTTNGGQAQGTPSAAAPSQLQGQSPSSTIPNSIVQIEVHRIANFNVVGGILFSGIHNNAFSVLSFGTTSATGMTAATSYVYQSQKEPIQVAGIAGITWYPGGKDYYPITGNKPWSGNWASVGSHTWRQRWTPGILFATSVTSLGTVFLGPDFEPRTGLDLFFGLTLGSHTYLPSNITPCTGKSIADCSKATQITGTAAPTNQSMALGFSAGFGFDANIFSVFGIK